MSNRNLTAAFSQLVNGRTFVAVDIETLIVPAEGKTKAYHRAISLSAVVMVNGQRREERHWLMNNGHNVDAKTEAIHQITDADLSLASPSTPVMEEFESFLIDDYPGCMLVCHNAAFDMGVLRLEFELADLKPLSMPVYDTMRIPNRLSLPNAVTHPKLVDLVSRYKITGNAVPGNAGRTRKSLVDARNTADVFKELIWEAATNGAIETQEQFDDATRPVPADAIKGSYPSAGKGAPAITIPSEHYKETHGTRLPDTLARQDIDGWLDQIRECIHLRCAFVHEKTQLEVRHSKRLLKPLSLLIVECQNPGDAGTLLLGLTPFLEEFDRVPARHWWEDHHETVKAAPACNGLTPCPMCAEALPCPQDTVYLTLGDRTTHYASLKELTSNRTFISLYTDNPPVRGVSAMAKAGMLDLAGYACWVGIIAYRELRIDRRQKEIMGLAIKYDLHKAEPRLALMHAQHLASLKQFKQVDAFIEEVLKAKTSDPAYLELEMWWLVTHKPTRSAAARAKAKKANRGPLKRNPSPVEKRPDDRVHQFGYKVYDKE